MSKFLRSVTVLTLALGVIATLGAGVASAAPSAQEIIDKYIDATGGRAAHEAVKSRVSKGVFALVDMGMSANMENYQAPPNYLSVVAIEGMGEVRSGISDGVTWEMHFMNGDSIKEGDDATGTKQQAALNEWLSWKDWYSSAEVAGEEDVDGTMCHKVDLTSKGGDESSVFFAQDSGLIIQRAAVGPDGMPGLMKISDYRDVGGVKVAHMTEIQGGMTVEMSFESIEHNVDIPADTFTLPDTISALQATE